MIDHYHVYCSNCSPQLLPETRERDEELAFFGTENGAVAFCKLEDRADHVITLVSNLPPVHLMCQTNSGDNIIVAADSTLAVFKSTNGRFHQISKRTLGLLKEILIFCYLTFFKLYFVDKCAD